MGEYLNSNHGGLDVTSRWKWVAASRIGTSHQRRGERCQDNTGVLVLPRGDGAVFLATCADGAGSASHSALGSRLACDTLIQHAAGFAREGGSAKDISQPVVQSWYGRAREALNEQATLDGVPLREYACTLMLAIIDETGGAFAQLGDGAIVIRDADGYKPVFWPQSGEYANMTHFLTGENYAEQVMACSGEGVPQDVALFTDGLQPLVLNYATRSAHVPFFVSLFDALGRHPCPEELQEPLERYLDSQVINDRTDDDKTLILATNRPVTHAHEPTVRQPIPPDPAG
jgi:hypothetical protein